MSKFYFNESIADNVSHNLNNTENNIRDIRKNLSKAVTQLEMCDGFDIVSCMNDVNSEMKIMEGIIEKADIGRSIINVAWATVQKYEKLAWNYSISNQGNFGDEFKPYGISKYNSRYQNAKAYVAGLLNGFNYIEEGVSGVLSGKGLSGIEYNNTKSSLELILKNICDGEYEYDTSAEEEAMKDVLKVLKLGKNLEEVLKSDLYDDTMKEYLKGISEFVDVKELSEEIVIGWYSDYTEAMMYLDALGSYNIDSDFVPEIIHELKVEYSNKYWQVFSTVLDEIMEKSGGAVISTALSGTVLGPIYSIEKFACEFTAKITGLDNVSDSFDALVGLTVLENNSMAAYNKAASIIESGNFTEADVDNFRKLFEMNRAIKISEYEALMTIDTEAEYVAKYQQAISELKAMKCPV